ncbi:MAG: DNA-binding response regulator, partial [Blastocatellia bacterium]
MSANDHDIKVLLVEDQRDVREGLSALINGSTGFRCLGAFRTMEEALRAVDKELPDVVLTDVGLPGMSGIEGTRVLKHTHPELPVVALTV